MRLVEFEAGASEDDTGGYRVAVNPEHVTMVRQWGTPTFNRTQIQNIAGACPIVVGSFDEVAAKLTTQRAETVEEIIKSWERRKP